MAQEQDRYVRQRHHLTEAQGWVPGHRDITRIKLPQGISMSIADLLQAALMCTGFPCTPFSALHAHSQLLRDSEAQQMYETIRRVKTCQPCVT